MILAKENILTSKKNTVENDCNKSKAYQNYFALLEFWYLESYKFYLRIKLV
jgi:hypothetical protein